MHSLLSTSQVDLPPMSLSTRNRNVHRLKRPSRRRRRCPPLLAVLERVTRQDVLRMLLLTCVLYVLLVSVSLYLWFPLVARGLTELGLPADAQALFDWLDGVQVRPVGEARCHWRSAWPLDERQMRAALERRMWQRESALGVNASIKRSTSRMPYSNRIRADTNHSATSCSLAPFPCDPAFEPLLWHNFSWSSHSSHTGRSSPTQTTGDLHTLLVLSAFLDTRPAAGASPASFRRSPLQWLSPSPSSHLRAVRVIAVVREPLPDEGLYCVQFVGEQEVAVEPIRPKDTFLTIGTGSYIGVRMPHSFVLCLTYRGRNRKYSTFKSIDSEKCKQWILLH